VIRWDLRKSPDREFEVEVDLTGQLPKDFIGTIYFIVNPDFSVSVQIHEHGKEAPPGAPFGHFVEKAQASGLPCKT